MAKEVNAQVAALVQKRLDEIEALKALDEQDKTGSIAVILFVQIGALITLAIVANATAGLYTLFIVGTVPGALPLSVGQVTGLLLCLVYAQLLRDIARTETLTNWQNSRDTMSRAFGLQIGISILSAYAYGVGAVIHWSMW